MPVYFVLLIKKETMPEISKQYLRCDRSVSTVLIYFWCPCFVNKYDIAILCQKEVWLVCCCRTVAGGVSSLPPLGSNCRHIIGGAEGREVVHGCAADLRLFSSTQTLHAREPTTNQQRCNGLAAYGVREETAPRRCSGPACHPVRHQSPPARW
jgi:hypothetical protein